MNRRSIRLSGAIFGTLAAVVLSSCSSDVRQQESTERPTGTLQPIGPLKGESALDSLYRQTGVPLIIIDEMVYLPSVPCVEPRKAGGETEDRKVGGETEDRKLVGQTEDRKLGGETEDRKVGGETEDRKLVGQTEDRKLGGETEDRNVRGEAEDRKLGGETEDRKLEGDTEKREVGGEAEDRKLGGETEGRDLGGASLDLRCSPFSSGQGFQILNPPRARIRVYDGISLKDVQGGRVMY
jgi:hypothetical protein